MTTIKPIQITGVAGLLAMLALSSQAQPYYVSGAYNGWSSPSPDVFTGTGPVYSCSVSNQTPHALSEFKVSTAPWANSWPSYNMTVMWDANGSNNFYFRPGPVSDGWQPGANRIGFDDPGTNWEIIGAFNGWDGSQPANAQMTTAGDGVYTVDYVVTNAGTYNFDFRTSGTWSELRCGAQIFNNSGSDGSFTTTTPMQTMRFQIDLPNGRFRIFDPSVPPVTNQVVFAVNMSVEELLNRFVPGTDGVFVSGDFNAWPGTSFGALVLTNVPTWGSNTNVYYATNTIVGNPGTTFEYKFVCNDPHSGYEPISQNRKFSLLSSNGVLVLPAVMFGNAYLSDYLTADTTVTFTVDMNGAMTSTNSPSNVNSPPGMNTPHAFNPNNGDVVFINGNFLTGGWISPWNSAIDFFNNVMTETYPGSQIYQFTYTVPKGNPVGMHYKYGIIYSSNPSTNNILDNEAPAGQDHVRYIRCTATGAYTNATDHFGNQYAESSFGQLASASAGAGQVSVSWLGRPGVQLQTKSSLSSGTWQSLVETDGTNWTSGTASSTGGFMSQTNWPTVGNQQFFRLIQAW